MTEEMIKELLEKLKQCDDFHNRCDFLMEHSEITYMLDYITNLQQENKQLKLQLLEKRCSDKDIEYKKRLKIENNWNKLKEWTKKAVDKYYDCDLRVDMVYKNVLNKMQELEKSDSNE